VPCWHEAAVIEDMLDTNLTAVGYHNYDVWLGVYPNDPETIARVTAAAARFPRIRHVVCPRDGPTTKADCLNAIYTGICAHEDAAGRRYEILLQHDAEDLVHPRALEAVRDACARVDMVQIPVFPLPTPLYRLTHGVYCDEFAEFHLKELFVRARLGGFVPSAGVGTAYRREAIEKLCEAGGGQPFAIDSLTEDYITGLQLRRLNCSQTLLHAWCAPPDKPQRSRRPIRRGSSELVATRAYFPFGLRAAIRQRSRWLTGNALQAWAAFGWRAGPGQLYWLWRDRKALIGSPASALANLLFLYGLARWFSLPATLRWNLEDWASGHTPLAAVLMANLAILAWRQSVRGLCSLRIYGFAHACATPLRAPWGNFLNVCATARALALFARSKALRRPLAWTKTDHDYPGREGSFADRQLLGKILVSMEVVSTAEIETALQQRLHGEQLGECLMRRGRIREEHLYQALALQAGLPFLRLDPGAVEELAQRYLRHAACGGEAVPFAVKQGPTVWVAVKTPPPEALRRRLERACQLPLRYGMVSASNFAALQQHPAREPVSIASPPAGEQPLKNRRRWRPVVPQMELRVPLPVWLANPRHLSITIEYRRAR
jgi:adsorption protein B